MTVSRRDVVGALGLGGGALGLGACASGSVGAPAQMKLASSTGKSGGNALFSLGVASGDPVSDGFVIWTRLAPQPLRGDGGMSGPADVIWQVAEDERFLNVVKSGELTATADWAHSVHVEVFGLRPLRQYYYRFIAQGQTSPTGKAKTAPVLGADVDRLRIGVASCQHYEQGFFNVYADMVEQDPDIIVHLGDYIYEVSWGPQVRRQASVEAITLDDYRIIHAQYKTDADLQAAHACAPWLFIWDDHEVVNDYANLHDEDFMPEPQMRARRAAAYKAYYEHMPLRARSRPHGADMRMHDYFYYGNLMTMALTDGRQYRDNQACISETDGGGRVVNCPELRDQSRSMFGAAQERWLMPSFLRSGAIWEVLAQPTLFSRLFQKDRDGVAGSWSDGWDGYKPTRDMILEAAAQRRPKNFISIGGDMHSWWQADLKADYNNPDSQTLGVEFVTTSVTAHSYAYSRFTRMLPDNPHIHFFDDRKRGYSLMDITPDRWTVQLREMSTIYTPEGRANTRKTFVVESGNPKALEA